MELCDFEQYVTLNDDEVAARYAVVSVWPGLLICLHKLLFNECSVANGRYALSCDVASCHRSRPCAKSFARSTITRP